MRGGGGVTWGIALVWFGLGDPPGRHCARFLWIHCGARSRPSKGGIGGHEGGMRAGMRRG